MDRAIQPPSHPEIESGRYLRPLSFIGLLLIALITHVSMGLALGNEVSVLGFHLSSGSFPLRALRVGMQIGRAEMSGERQGC